MPKNSWDKQTKMLEMEKSTIKTTEAIKNKIFTIRGTQVIIDRDLAELYGVTTKALNQAVKRNIERFPEDFMFQLSTTEKNELVTICDRLKPLRHSAKNPYAFTEQGVSMLSAVLRSEHAIKVNIKIIRAFVAMRRFLANNDQLFQRLERIELKQLEHDKKFDEVFKALKNHKPKQGIFFDGQIFDAHKFVSDLIRSAKKSIVLIDNYIDDSVLTLFSKRKKGVPVIIYTKNITKQLMLDLDKFNSQYEAIEIKEFGKSHDRFLIIDNVVYHIGASLKDLGKKWFAFSRLDIEGIKMLRKII